MAADFKNNKITIYYISFANKKRRVHHQSHLWYWRCNWMFHPHVWLYTPQEIIIMLRNNFCSEQVIGFHRKEVQNKKISTLKIFKPYWAFLSKFYLLLDYRKYKSKARSWSSKDMAVITYINSQYLEVTIFHI